MNWYKKAIRKIYIPENDYDNLMVLVDKMSRGETNWTPEDLQMQQTYPEAVEVLLKKKMSKSACKTGTCQI